MYDAKTSAGSNATASYSFGYGAQPTNASLAMPMNTYTMLQASGPVNYSVLPMIQMPSKGMYGTYKKE